MFRPYSAIFRQLSNLLKLLHCFFNIFHFVIHSFKTFVAEHHSLHFHVLPSFCSITVSRVICVAHMDVGVVLLSCYYVPHWCVCLYTVGLVECVSLIIIFLSFLSAPYNIFHDML
jgi:hypothetical protein